MKTMKELFDMCSSEHLIINDEVQYPWKAWGYCSQCGFGNCKHIQDDADKSMRT